MTADKALEILKKESGCRHATADECNKYDECDRATNNHKRLRFRWKNTPIEVNINPFMYSRFEDGVYIDDLLFW